MIKAVVFDIGAVLLGFDWNGFLRQRFDDETAEAVYAATWGTKAWTELDRDALPSHEVMRRFYANAPEYAPQISEAMENVAECAVMKPYAREWIREIKAEGFKVYFLSNFFPHLLWKASDQLSFLQDMDGGVFSWQEKVTKPDAEIYQILLERYQLKAEECVFIDDSKINIDAADEIGFHVFRFESYEEQHPEIMHVLAEHTH